MLYIIKNSMCINYEVTIQIMIGMYSWPQRSHKSFCNALLDLTHSSTHKQCLCHLEGFPFWKATGEVCHL